MKALTIIAASLFFAAAAPCGADSPLQLSLFIDGPQTLPGVPPADLTVRVKNSSRQAVSLGGSLVVLEIQSETSTAYARCGEATLSDAKFYKALLDGAAPMETLNAGDSTVARWTGSMPGVSNCWFHDPAFAQPGKYQLRILLTNIEAMHRHEADGIPLAYDTASEPVSFEIVLPQGADADAFTWLRSVAPAQLVTPRVVARNAQVIWKKFPESRYAEYAALGIASKGPQPDSSIEALERFPEGRWANEIRIQLAGWYTERAEYAAESGDQVGRQKDAENATRLLSEVDLDKEAPGWRAPLEEIQKDCEGRLKRLPTIRVKDPK